MQSKGRRVLRRRRPFHAAQTQRRSGLYDWQAFAAILPVKTVGVMGDGRTYDHVACAR